MWGSDLSVLSARLFSSSLFTSLALFLKLISRTLLVLTELVSLRLAALMSFFIFSLSSLTNARFLPK